MKSQSLVNVEQILVLIQNNFISDKVNCIAGAMVNIIVNLPIREISDIPFSELLADCRVRIIKKQVHLEVYFPVIDFMFLVTEDGRVLANIAESNNLEVSNGEFIDMYRRQVEFLSRTLGLKDCDR